MQAGDFGQLDRVMTRVNKDKLIKMYVDRNGEIATAWKRTGELNAAVNEDAMNAIEDQFYAGRISGTQVLNQAKALGITLPDAKRKALIAGEGAGANEMMYGQFESLADRQLVGEAYFDDLATNKVISWKQANTLKKQVRNDNPEMSRGRQLIDFTLGINDPLSPGIGDAKKVAATAKAELMNRQQQARASGEQFNPYEVASIIVASKEVQQEIKKQETSKTRISKKFEEKKIAYDTGRIYTKEDLKRLGFNDSDAAVILRAQNGR
jgi:parvulin-like peptidyl-prolyl isomerase